MLIIILFLNYINKRYFYPIGKINFKKDEAPITWDLYNKQIVDIVTITFLFKLDTNINYNYNFFSFGFYNQFYHYINIYEYDSNKFSFRLNQENNDSNFNLKFHEHYNIYLELKKISIGGSSNYKIECTFSFYHAYFNLDKKVLLSTEIDNNIDFNKFFINIGSKDPKELVKFDFLIENWALINRKLTDDELDDMYFGYAKPLLFLDFANSLIYSQYFYNKIENNFSGGINGNSWNYDNNDLYHENIKISNSNIIKKLYIFDNRQFIKLSQELIQYISNYDISDFIIYFKISIILNNLSTINNLNKNYKLYNREKKTIINIRLLDINSNGNKFELRINLEEDTSKNFNVPSIDNEYNFRYMIIKYQKTLSSEQYHVNFDILNKDNILLNHVYFLTYNFSSNDNHYIGDYDGTKFNKSYILIELEEFMFGKGAFLKNSNNDIYYDNILLNCNVNNKNKLDRKTLNSCDNRPENTAINDFCEYYESVSNCIFKLPDFDDKVITSNINTVLKSILNTQISTPSTTTTTDLLNEINNYITSFNTMYSSNLDLFYFTLINKPYRQYFNSLPHIYINTLKQSNSPNSFINFEYIQGFNLNINNNIIIEIIIENNNIESNIFEIEFNNKNYSNFPIKFDLKYQVISVEIFNDSGIVLNNPEIKIKKLSSNSNQFKIISLKILQIDESLINIKQEKFIGERINDFYKIFKNKFYSNNSPNLTNYRNLNNILIECDQSCNGCDGPIIKNCNMCNSNYLIFKDHCLEKKAKNCLTFGGNPSFCETCKINFEVIKLDDDRVNCITCNSDCKDKNCDTTICSEECLKCDPLTFNINCISCPSECFRCNNNNCYGELKTECYKCKDPLKKLDNNPNNLNICKSCSKKGIILKRKEYCDECHPNCELCSNSNENSCLECKPNFILYYNKICRPIYQSTTFCEPNHVYKKGDTNNYYERNDKCLKCGEGCNSCDLNNNSICLDCLYGFHLNNNTCIRCDKDGQFKDENNKDKNKQPKCNNCHSNCKKCNSTSENNCLECFNNHYLFNIGNDMNNCILCNINGYYIENLYCKKCLNSCIKCTNNKICLQCQPGYYLDNIKKDCILKCRIGFYKNGDNCFKCQHNCFNCHNGNENSCIDCINGFYLDIENNKCILCNEINKVIINKKCYNCDQNCWSCYGINDSNCLSCDKDFILYENLNKCVKKCPENTYKIKINNLFYCRDCYYTCLNCIDSKENSCLNCKKNYIYNKYTKRCELYCENGYFLLNNQCEKCKQNCLKCINNNSCLKCKKNFYLKDKKYCTKCNENGYYRSNNNCLKCDKNCLNCIDNDNCTKCELNKKLVYNLKNNKYYCKLECNNSKIFDKNLNKCILCSECENCQIKNEYFCENCTKCNKKCIFDLKFNETGLYLLNENNKIRIDNEWIKSENNILIENTKILFNYYFFKIKNNNDNLKEIKIKISNNSILKSNNCSHKNNKIFGIKKIFNKSCQITNIYYNYSNNLLNIKFNFKILENEIKNNFYYKINNLKANYKNYEIKNIILINDREIKFKFFPNYFKNKFNITIFFDNKIIKEINCKATTFIKINFMINSTKRIFYEDEITMKSNQLTSTLDDVDNLIKPENSKIIVDQTQNTIITTIIISSIFSQFLSLLIRFFQIVYILDYIILLKINLGKYTNTFIKYYNINYEINFELNKIFNLPYNNMEKKISKILINNPKLKNAEFIYLTNTNIEFFILISLIVLEKTLKLGIYLFNIFNKSKANDTTTNIKKKKYLNKIINIKNITQEENIVYSRKNIIKIEKKKSKKLSSIRKTYEKIQKENNVNVYKNVILFIISKINFIKITYLGSIFPNLLGSLFIYSQMFYNLNLFDFGDFKLFTIYLIYYFFVIIYFYEISISVLDHNKFNKQKVNCEYRNDFFLFDNRNKGIHNLAVLITLIRDFFLIFIIVLINTDVLIKIILFLIIQLIFFIFISFMRSKYDYKNIKLFKIQEVINLVIIIDALILYFTKYELFQFIFIIAYLFLVLISLINLYYEILSLLIHKLIIFIKYLISKIKKKKINVIHK